MEQEQRLPVDAHDRDFDIGLIDVVMSILTLPLIFWALMYAVSGHEELYATREGRMRVYWLLLAIEAVLGIGVAIWWYVR